MKIINSVRVVQSTFKKVRSYIESLIISNTIRRQIMIEHSGVVSVQTLYAQCVLKYLLTCFFAQKPQSS